MLFRSEGFDPFVPGGIASHHIAAGTLGMAVEWRVLWTLAEFLATVGCMVLIEANVA